MRALQDKNMRFLFAGTGLILAAALVWGGFLHFWQINHVKRLLLEQTYAAADRMLEIGMSRDEVAFCLEKSKKDSGAGRMLFNELGYTSRVKVYLLPALSDFNRRRAVLGGIELLTLTAASACLLISYQRRIRSVFETACDRVRGFMDGKFDEKLPEADQGDMSLLFSAVNRMASALYDKGRAEERARLFLKDMIADISHQFKTPIAALSMNTEIMEAEAGDPEVVRSFAGKNRLSIDRLQSLIASFLKLARLDVGAIVFDKREIPVNMLVREAVEELQVRAEQEKKELTASGEDGVTVFCDPGWSKEAVSNLIKNALDHTKEGGHIHVGWKRTALFVSIFVEDDGSGIHEEDLYYIFRRFYRSRYSQDTGGVGLGLALVKAVMEGQDGEVTVQSRLGEGSRFTLSYKTVI